MAKEIYNKSMVKITKLLLKIFNKEVSCTFGNICRCGIFNKFYNGFFYFFNCIKAFKEKNDL